MLMRVVRWVAGTAILVLLLPILMPITAGLIASAHGCRLDEGSIHSCIVMGQDMGQTLYTLFVLGWLGIGAAVGRPVQALVAVRLRAHDRAVIDSFAAPSGWSEGPYRYAITGVRLVVKYGILR